MKTFNYTYPVNVYFGEGSAKTEKKNKIAIRENKRDKIFLWNRIYSGTCTFSLSY